MASPTGAPSRPRKYVWLKRSKPAHNPIIFNQTEKNHDYTYHFDKLTHHLVRRPVSIAYYGLLIKFRLHANFDKMILFSLFFEKFRQNFLKVGTRTNIQMTRIIWGKSSKLRTWIFVVTQSLVIIFEHNRQLMKASQYSVIFLHSGAREQFI